MDPVAQSVLVARKSSFPSASMSPLENASHVRDASHDPNSHQNHQPYSDTSDVLMAPKFMDSGGNDLNLIEHGCATDRTLTAIQQAVVLAHCLLIEKRARFDEQQSKLTFLN